MQFVLKIDLHGKIRIDDMLLFFNITSLLSTKQS